MNSEDIIEIVKDINRKNSSPIDENIIRKIILQIIDHPLEGDRGICQEELRKIIIEKVG